MLRQDELKGMPAGATYTEAEVFETKREAKDYITRRRNCINQIARRASVSVEFFNTTCQDGPHKIGIVMCQKLGDVQ